MQRAKALRKIIKINESACDGCGICADACHEGAIAIVEGKAKLVSESYCDGLGDCIGECPRDAIAFEMRPADDYDEAAVKERLSVLKRHDLETAGNLPCGCPGSMAREIGESPRGCPVSAAWGLSAEQEISVGSSANVTTADRQKSRLRNWPVQLMLIPIQAAYLKNAALLVAADCSAFAFAGFHSELLPGKVCLVGCPKLDDATAYREKLSQIIKRNGIRSIDVAYMEVPCCNGLLGAVREAVKEAGVPVPVRGIRLSLEGEIMECEWL